jgi:hypothetical protein
MLRGREEMFGTPSDKSVEGFLFEFYDVALVDVGSENGVVDEYRGREESRNFEILDILVDERSYRGSTDRNQHGFLFEDIVDLFEFARTAFDRQILVLELFEEDIEPRVPDEGKIEPVLNLSGMEIRHDVSAHVPEIYSGDENIIVLRLVILGFDERRGRTFHFFELDGESDFFQAGYDFRGNVGYFGFRAG